MAALQTYPVNALGGLDLMSTPQSLAEKPGWALKLTNYEALVEGGYKKIKGYKRYSTLPDEWGSLNIRGITYYKGVVIVLDNMVLHCPDGSTWWVVNKDKATGVDNTALPALTLLPREGKDPVDFATMNVNGIDTLIITDDVSNPASLVIEDNKYTYTEGTDNVKGFNHITHYQDHVVLAGSLKEPGKVAVSARFSSTDFEGQGSWSVQVQDEITGVHTFRDFLYIFCRDSIYRVSNIENKDQVAVRPVTTKLGCVDGRSIQEIGGDVLFLSADGLRYLGATERIDDVSINMVSSIITDVVEDIDFENGPLSSIVLRRKGQYRLFYQDKLGRRKGIIGTLMADGSFAWSTTGDLNVLGITSAMVGTSEVAYHIGSPSYGEIAVYEHDVGFDADGSVLEATWATPWFHFGDSAVRKRLHDMVLYLDSEGQAEVQVTLKFDNDNPQTMQPEPFYLAPVIEASVWGDFKWGTTKYGSLVYPLDSVFLEGSGKWVQFTFKDSALDNTDYIIRGFDIHFTTGGRI